MRALVVAALVAGARGAAVPSVTFATACDVNHFYDASRFACRLCTDDGGDANAIPDTSSMDTNGNYVRCTCPAGYKEVLPTTACDAGSMEQCASFACEACAGSAAPARDKTLCMTCPAAVDATTKECVCGTNEAVTEMDVLGNYLLSGGVKTKVCATCPTGKYLSSADPRLCAACPHPDMTMASDGVCSCTGGTLCGVAGMGLLSGGVYTEACALTADTTPIIGTTYDPTAAIVVNFGSGNVNSVVFKHHYLWAATRCYQWGRVRDTASCEALGNLCVLSNYVSTAIPCKLYRAIMAQRTKLADPQIYGWASTLPWLDYSDDTGGYAVETDVLWNTAVPKKVELMSELTFYIARYAINGTFLAMERLEDQLSYCCSGGAENGFAPPTSTGLPWMFFGANYERTCTCSLSKLVSRSRGTMDLFELYLDDGTSSSTTTRAFTVLFATFICPNRCRAAQSNALTH